MSGRVGDLVHRTNALAAGHTATTEMPVPVAVTQRPGLGFTDVCFTKRGRDLVFSRCVDESDRPVPVQWVRDAGEFRVRIYGRQGVTE